MGSRYLALIGAETGMCDRIAVGAGKARLTVAIDRPGLLVLVETGAATIPIGEEGVVIGALYTIGHTGPVEALGLDGQAAITSSSNELPAEGVAELSRAATMSPARPASTPRLTKVKKVSCSVLTPERRAARMLPPSA